MDLGALLQALIFANTSLAICFKFFFFRLLCLDAFICIHNVCACNSHHSKVAAVTDFAVVSFCKWDKSTTITSWLGAGPGGRVAGFQSCLGHECLPLPELPLAGTDKAFK